MHRVSKVLSNVKLQFAICKTQATIILNKILCKLKLNLEQKSYKGNEINDNIQAVIENYDRDTILSTEKNTKKKSTPLVFVTKYNPEIHKRKLIKYWHIMIREENF